MTIKEYTAAPTIDRFQGARAEAEKQMVMAHCPHRICQTSDCISGIQSG